MRIIIIGAGLGGLTAAYAFARNNKHNVIVLERSSTLSHQGSGLSIRPGATRVLHSWGLETDLRAVSDKAPTVLIRDLRDGSYLMGNTLDGGSEVPNWRTDRTHLMRLFYEKAVEVGACVRFGEMVVGVSEDGSKASVVLHDGEVLHAELVLCADGIRSRMRAFVLKDLIGCGVQTEPIISNITFYGIQMSSEQVLGNNETAKALIDENAITVYMGKQAFAITGYNTTLRVWGGLYGLMGESSSEQRGLWDENGDIEWVKKWFGEHGLCPELMAALKSTDTCDRWKLAEMPNLPRWSSKDGRVVLLGDSAHGMHPNAAMGYSMIVENVGVLEFLLDRAGNGAAEGIPEIVRMWELIRKPRVERIKEYAKWNTTMFTVGEVTPKAATERTVVKNLTNVKPDMNAEFKSSRFVKWSLDHDAVREAKKHVEKVHARL